MPVMSAAQKSGLPLSEAPVKAGHLEPPDPEDGWALQATPRWLPLILREFP